MKQTTQDRAVIQKHVRPGRTQDGDDVFITVYYRDGKLSITGVEGPKANGDATGSCGQIVDTLSRLSTLAPGWSPEQVAKLREVWECWHLNDMRPACEHQRGAWNPAERLEVVSYKLTHAAYRLRERAREAVTANALGGLPILVQTPTIEALMRLENWFSPIFTPPDADSPLSGCYEVDKREHKAAGWVRPSEHPRGLLCKPCEVCGYEYGSKWLFEEVPVDVLDYLEALPKADKPMPGTWGRF